MFMRVEQKQREKKINKKQTKLVEKRKLQNKRKTP